MAEKILVVDDDLDSLKLIGLLLQRQGYEVVAAPGGREGLAMAKVKTPDLILLDVMMPNMDGYEVCRQLRIDPELTHIPVIMFTAKTQISDKVAGFEAGADDYLTKPTHPAELASRIRASLVRSATIRSVVLEHAQGKVIALLGVMGGTGTTTLAVNLSIALAKAGQNVILADMNPGMGAVGLQLGYPQQDGLSQLLKQALEELSKEQLEMRLTEYASGMRLLLSAYNPMEAAASPSVMHIERITSLLPQMADLAILDLGNGIGDACLQALAQADQVILCLSPRRNSVAMAQTLFDHMRQRGIHPNRVGVAFVNTTPSLPASSARQAKEQLQLPVLGSIEPAPELAIASLEREQPMVMLQPSSPTTRQFRELGQRILAKLAQEIPVE